MQSEKAGEKDTLIESGALLSQPKIPFKRIKLYSCRLQPPFDGNSGGIVIAGKNLRSVQLKDIPKES